MHERAITNVLQFVITDPQTAFQVRTLVTRLYIHLTHTYMHPCTHHTLLVCVHAQVPQAFQSDVDVETNNIMSVFPKELPPQLSQLEPVLMLLDTALLAVCVLLHTSYLCVVCYMIGFGIILNDSLTFSPRFDWSFCLTLPPSSGHQY